jgi:AraC-like DNA-binding protein
MRKTPTPSKQVVRVRYEAPAGYELDLEMFSLSEFRRRVSAEHLRKPQRVDFHVLLYVTEGRCVHMVDFERFACRQGTLLVLSPGQIQRFDAKSTDWEGWMVIFRPELLPAQASAADSSEHDALYLLADLSVHRALSGSEQEAVTESLERMVADAQLRTSTGALQSLLRHQLMALLMRLQLIQGKGRAESNTAPVLLQRFKRFRLTVERELAHLHQVADYSKLIGCSQKSLQRASLSVVGVSAKAYLSQRIALEAKRLLVHTDQSVSAIADSLGFDEATNFVKFFRHQVDTVPSEFRRRHTMR